MEGLDAIEEKIRSTFVAKNAARDLALAKSRELIRHCSLSIRATHRGEYDEARNILATARGVAEAMKQDVAAYPDLYWTGYVQDSLKEFSEASIVLALITGQAVPDPEAIGVDYAAYLNGLGEAAGELRRYTLDIIRHNELERSEQTLQQMEDIYSLLVTMDFPDALTGGLRRTTDMVRGVLERTRGDLTMAWRQNKLEARLGESEAHVAGSQAPTA